MLERGANKWLFIITWVVMGNMIIFPLLGYTASIRKGPYLIYPGENTKMTVHWQANNTPSSGSTIEWGSTTSYGNGPVSVPENGTGANEHQFTHTITGLTPGSFYYYRVTVDGQQNTGSFLAAPDISATSVTLYAYGDTRYSIQNDINTKMIEDIDVSPGTRQTICLHSGDWVTNGDQEDDWNNHYFNRSMGKALELMSRVATMGCRGNHDTKNDPTLLRKYWPYNYQDGTGCYYSFDYGPVHVAVVDHYVEYSSGSTQYNWLADDLFNTTAQWKIVIFHIPTYGAVSWTAASLCPLFMKQGVDVTIAGHHHSYSHAYVGGIHHLTAAGGGAGLYDLTMHDYILKASKEYNFVRLSVNGNIMTVTAFNRSGAEIENFQIIKSTPVFEENIRQTDFSNFSYTNPLRISRTELKPNTKIYSLEGKLMDVDYITDNSIYLIQKDNSKLFQKVLITR